MKRRDADDFRRDMEAKQRSTPGDTERKERIAANASECLRRLKGNQTYEDWRGVGAQMMVITEEVLNDLALDAWNKDDKQLVREFARRFEGWEASVSNAKPISKQERWALRQLMTDPKYHTFYMTELLGPEQRKTNHPNKIIEKYNRKYPDPNKPKKPPREPSPALSPALASRDKRIAELEARVTEQDEELEAARDMGPPAREIGLLDDAMTALWMCFGSLGSNEPEIKGVMSADLYAYWQKHWKKAKPPTTKAEKDAAWKAVTAVAGKALAGANKALKSGPKEPKAKLTKAAKGKKPAK